MKRSFLLYFIILAAVNSFAQKSIDGLIQAEKSFAAFSVANSTKEAFLQFLDSNGLVFDKGKAVNGLEFWNKKEKSPGILNWRPLYADISASGDFGYTTGPWTFQPGTINDSIVARGQYTTVWHKDKKGDWKFLIDLGVHDTPENTDTSSWWTLSKNDPANYHGTRASLIKIENEFIKRTQNNISKGWERTEWYKRNYYTDGFVFSRNNRLPAVFYESFMGVMNTMPSAIQYSIIGSGIAASGDLGYVYGTTVINGKTDNYLRIWRKERSGWKIVVEVLRY